MSENSSKPRDLGVDVHGLVTKIMPILAEADGGVQFACLGDLVALFLASHDEEDARNELLKVHVDMVQQLLPKRLAELDRRQRAAAERDGAQVH